MFLFNFISGLDNYPIPLVFTPQHTHNYKSLRDAVFETNVKTANKSMMSAIFRIPPPKKNGMGWKGGWADYKWKTVCNFIHNTPLQ